MSTPQPRPRLGISSCLLGNDVRYDGGHKRNEFLTGSLGPFVDWVPACPEVDIGLGTPRPPILLESDRVSGLRLVMPETGEDLTDRMTAYAERRIETLRTERISGYVLKSQSPTCGMEQVSVYDGKHDSGPVGVGLFAAILKRRMPHLPLEEEGRLDDPCLREAFITRIFARARWLELKKAGTSLRGLTRFHARHKYLLMSRDPSAAGTLDDLLGEADDRRADMAQLAEKYGRTFGEALSRIPSRDSHVNVLERMAEDGFESIESGDRDELRQVIDSYRAGVVALSGPVTVLREHARKYGIEDLCDQVYLEPHPDEMNLLHEV